LLSADSAQYKIYLFRTPIRCRRGSRSVFRSASRSWPDQNSHL